LQQVEKPDYADEFIHSPGIGRANSEIPKFSLTNAKNR
jgi:hypothetical protein